MPLFEKFKGEKKTEEQPIEKAKDEIVETQKEIDELKKKIEKLLKVKSLEELISEVVGKPPLYDERFWAQPANLSAPDRISTDWKKADMLNYIKEQLSLPEMQSISNPELEKLKKEYRDKVLEKANELASKEK